jgi:hypothetical protein
LLLDLLTLLFSLLSLQLGLLVLLFGLLHLLQSLQLLLLRLIIVGVEGYAAVADQSRWCLRVLSACIRQPHGSAIKRRLSIEPPSVDQCEHGDGRHPGENQVDRPHLPAPRAGWMDLTGTGCAHSSICAL